MDRNIKIMLIIHDVSGYYTYAPKTNSPISYLTVTLNWPYIYNNNTKLCVYIYIYWNFKIMGLKYLNFVPGTLDSAFNAQNPKYFPNPEEFDPSRFKGSGPPSYTFIPFGGGPRTCPGKEYARLVILVFLHNIVTKFKLEKASKWKNTTYRSNVPSFKSCHRSSCSASSKIKLISSWSSLQCYSWLLSICDAILLGFYVCF